MSGPPQRPGPTIPGAPAHLETVPDRQPAPQRKRWPFLVGAIVLVLGAVLAIVWGPIKHSITMSQARAHGIVLDEEIGEIDLGWGEVTLRDFAFELDGVDGVRGQGVEMTVDLDGLDAAALTAKGMEIDLVGSAAVLAVAVSEWTGDHPELVSIPTKAEEVSVSWKESSGGTTWLKLRQGTIEPLENGAKLEAKRTSVFGLSVGGIGAVWKGDEAKVKLGFGRSDQAGAPIAIEVEDLRSQPKATIKLRPTPLAKLSGPLGVLLPIPDVDVSGDARFQYEGKRNAPIVGSFDATLDGFTPPMPRLAQGFVFGDVTKVSSDVKLGPKRKKIAFTNTKLVHGPVSLRGSGSVLRDGDEATVELVLKGSVSCADLAKAALKAGLGKRLGPLVDQLASGGIKGSVSIELDIKASTDDWLGAKIDRRIGVGCGVTWPDLPGLPEGLPKLPNIPGLPSFEP